MRDLQGFGSNGSDHALPASGQAAVCAENALIIEEVVSNSSTEHPDRSGEAVQCWTTWHLPCCEVEISFNLQGNYSTEPEQVFNL